MELIMFNNLPQQITDFMHWTWEDIAPYYRDLAERLLVAESVTGWLSDWTRINDLVSERYARLNVGVTVDTNDAEAEKHYNAFLDEIYPPFQAAEQRLKQKLLESGLEPAGFEVPLRKMQVEAEIFREANLPLLSEERKLASQYNKIIGAQTVSWEGQELTLQQMRPIMQDELREKREKAWRLVSGRQLADRVAINELWQKFMPLRVNLAENAQVSDFREYRWRQMLRLDYTPGNCLEFQAAIESVVVPAATRVYERHRQRLDVASLRPWDLDQDIYPIQFPALPSYGTIKDLQAVAETIFHRVDPKLGVDFHIMRQEGFLDLDNRKGKAPGAYCTGYPVTQRPFIFMNAVGLSADVRTILHESGHAFHNFERLSLPYAQQRNTGLEFAEVASMAMELLASPYLATSQGGYYSESDAAHFMIEHLEHLLIFWPYMAVVDAFQHWAYTNPGRAIDPSVCDAHWLDLWNRFIPGVDWSGFEQEAMTGWHRKQHIYRYPFYYVEYGLAQLGAVQVWSNALKDQAHAVVRYREALSLGGTATLPQLYQVAGAKFAFDVETLGAAVDLVESTIQALINK
jgi:oligoendopeptidase F